MKPLRVATWNVLHRVHAVNWGEQAIAAWPDEPARQAAIAAKVRAWLEQGVDVVCLQEVSGDQLAVLRTAARGLADVFHHPLPRLPRLRHGGAPILGDSSEHLVALAAPGRAMLVDARTSETDPGKGFLCLGLDGDARVACGHVTWGLAGVAQLEAMAAQARAAGACGVVAGDFNAHADAVQAALGPDFALADLAGQRPTRVATPKSPAHTIDHIGVVRGQVDAAEVQDAGTLSDHHPVLATVRPG